MKLQLALAIVAMLGLGPALACGGGDGDEPDAPSITVVNYNILHGIINEDEAAEPFDHMSERIELTARALAEVEPDIIMLQEVFLNTENDYPDVRRIILDALGPEYTAIHGDVRGNDIGGAKSLPLGQMTLTRLPIVSSENYFLGGVRSVHRVTVQSESGPIDVYNTHLEGTGAVTDAGEDEALIEINQVLAFIGSTRSGSGPVILAGDLNATPDESSPLKLIDEGFIDVLAEGGDATCTGAGDPGCTGSALPLGDNPDNNADHRIDYIFVLPGSEYSLDIAAAQLFNNEPFDIGDGRLLWASDHIGVQAVFEIVPGGG